MGEPRERWYSEFALTALENKDWEGMSTFDRAAHDYDQEAMDTEYLQRPQHRQPTYRRRNGDAS